MVKVMSAKHKAKLDQEKANLSIIYYRPHDGDYVRVWRPFWFGDQFEVMLIADFERGRALLQRLGFRIIEAGDDD